MDISIKDCQKSVKIDKDLLTFRQRKHHENNLEIYGYVYIKLSANF